MTRTVTPWGAWDPAAPAEVAALFRDGGAPWWIAGGYAIELAVGRPVREHDDIDVLVLRRDQLMVQRALAGWDWQAADPPGTLRPWRPGELLPAGVHDIWCRPGPGRPWRIQVMLDESAGARWVSRRDPRVARPVARVGCLTAAGIPYLAPEIQLFYKAGSARPKDEADFRAARPGLTPFRRKWLHDALVLAYGGHPWCARLR
jgi:hypothetical protein